MSHSKKTTPVEKSSFDAFRRQFIENTSLMAGLAVVTPAVSFSARSNCVAASESTLSAEEMRSQHERFVAKVLNKYASKSRRIRSEYIDGFAKGFVELNGSIDYENTFEGLTGEYRLVKIFIRSVNSSHLPA